MSKPMIARALCCAAGLALAGASVAPGQAIRPPSVDDPAAVAREGIALDLAASLDGGVLSPPPARAFVATHGASLVVEFHVQGEGDASLDVPRDASALFEHAAVEVFLSSAGDPAEGYYHFSANAAGSVHDESVRDGGWTRDPLWDAPVTAEPVSTAPEGTWGVRLSIPLAILRRQVPEFPPMPGLPDEAWFQVSAASFPAEGAPVAASWGPAASTFHDPQAFRRMALDGVDAAMRGALTTRFETADDSVTIESSLIATEDFAGPLRVDAMLRPASATALAVPLFQDIVASPAETASHTLPIDKLATGRYFVTQLRDEENTLQDQLVQDWLFTETAPVSALHERFREKLVVRFAPTPGDPVRAARVERDGKIHWETGPGAMPEGAVEIDTSDWPAGPYTLSWERDSGGDEVAIGRVADSAPPVAERWAFWGYAPDEEVLGELVAFEQMAQCGEHLAGFIYGGSVDATTGALSALDIDSLAAWKQALPGAQMHLMIDGQGSFDLVDDAQVEAIARRLVDELMPSPHVDGLHFDLEPYHASQVRLTRKLTELGWTKPLSIAAGLATTIPAEQWASIDFMVVMNYDLGRTPEAFARRASENARAFASAAARHDRQILVGIPVVATHNEFALVIEAATGEVVERTEAGTMMPFVEPALGIFTELAADPDLAPHVAAPVLWAALARSQTVGQRRYRYFPNTIEGVVWDRLLEFDEDRKAP